MGAGEIVQVLDTATSMKQVLAPVKKLPTLRGKTIVTAFYEASTRTRISFEVAAKILGADAVNMTASASSVTKGESLLGHHPHTPGDRRRHGGDAPSAERRALGRRGPRRRLDRQRRRRLARPPQALLDLFTMRERLGRVEGLVTILGDVLHSRVARSDIWGLSLLGADVTVCGPPTPPARLGRRAGDAALEAPRPGTDRAGTRVPTW